MTVNRWLVTAGVLLLPGAAAGQATHVHEAHLTVRDVATSVTWYSEAFGFRVTYHRQSADSTWEAQLALGRALLFLTEAEPGRGEGTTAVIKLGVRVTDLETVQARLERVAPESVLVPRASLPESDLEGWPAEHVLAIDPDGTLVQAFDGASPDMAEHWLLAAVTVPDLEVGVSWYEDQAGFTEVVRPEGGDPRSLLRRGGFYLEVGEFGPVDPEAGAGVVSLVVEAPGSPCRDLEPHGFERLRVCD